MYCSETRMDPQDNVAENSAHELAANQHYQNRPCAWWGRFSWISPADQTSFVSLISTVSREWKIDIGPFPESPGLCYLVTSAIPPSSITAKLPFTRFFFFFAAFTAHSETTGLCLIYQLENRSLENSFASLSRFQISCYQIEQIRLMLHTACWNMHLSRWLNDAD